MRIDAREVTERPERGRTMKIITYDNPSQALADARRLMRAATEAAEQKAGRNG